MVISDIDDYEQLNSHFLKKFLPSIKQDPEGQAMHDLVEDLLHAERIFHKAQTKSEPELIRYVPSWNDDRKSRYMEIIDFLVSEKNKKFIIEKVNASRIYLSYCD